MNQSLDIHHPYVEGLLRLIGTAFILQFTLQFDPIQSSGFDSVFIVGIYLVNIIWFVGYPIFEQFFLKHLTAHIGTDGTKILQQPNTITYFKGAFFLISFLLFANLLPWILLSNRVMPLYIICSLFTLILSIQLLLFNGPIYQLCSNQEIKTFSYWNLPFVTALVLIIQIVSDNPFTTYTFVMIASVYIIEQSCKVYLILKRTHQKT